MYRDTSSVDCEIKYTCVAMKPDIKLIYIDMYYIYIKELDSTGRDGMGRDGMGQDRIFCHPHFILYLIHRKPLRYITHSWIIVECHVTLTTGAQLTRDLIGSPYYVPAGCGLFFKDLSRCDI